MTQNASDCPISLWRDLDFRPGSEHMALDEAMLAAVGCDSGRKAAHDGVLLRFYRWKEPEITIGVFVPVATVADRTCPITRRWTGGGVVEHGTDLTFSLAIPAIRLAPENRAADYYRWIHESLAGALQESGLAEAVAEQSALPASPETAGFCFSAPVAWDVMDRSTGAKIAGGAQRRSRAGLLHQGSVRLPTPWNAIDHPWITRFAEKLAPGTMVESFSPGPEFFAAADKLRIERYAHPDWLARR
jgi:lipoate-protein ligase A